MSNIPVYLSDMHLVFYCQREVVRNTFNCVGGVVVILFIVTVEYYLSNQITIKGGLYTQKFRNSKKPQNCNIV